MILHEIDIKLKTDHPIEWEEQEYHDFYIESFKRIFSKWLDRCGISISNKTCIDMYYLVDQRKFYIKKITFAERRIREMIKSDTNFYQKFFTDTE